MKWRCAAWCLVLGVLGAVVVPARGAGAPGQVEQRRLLSRHDTIATLDGIIDQPCRFRTALCPDRCGHGGKVAVFKINRYLQYEKPGQYGDPKAASYQFQVEDQQGNAKVPASLRKDVMALKKGDVVRLEWRHDYVTREGASFPERPVVRMEKTEPGKEPAPAADPPPLPQPDTAPASTPVPAKKSAR